MSHFQDCTDTTAKIHTLAVWPSCFYEVNRKTSPHQALLNFRHHIIHSKHVSLMQNPFLTHFTDRHPLYIYSLTRSFDNLRKLRTSVKTSIQSDIRCLKVKIKRCDVNENMAFHSRLYSLNHFLKKPMGELTAEPIFRRVLRSLMMPRAHLEDRHMLTWQQQVVLVRLRIGQQTA